MRSFAVMAMIAGAFYLWPHFRGLPIFQKLQPGPAWLCSALLSALLLFCTALANSVLVGFYLYLCMFYVITDTVFLAIRLLSRIKQIEAGWRRIYLGGVLPVVLSLMVCIYGIFNAKNIVVTTYDVSVQKPLAAPARIAFISDMHIGTAIQKEDLDGIAKKIMALSPDMIVLGGDIYEERTTEEERLASYHAFEKLHAPLGVYYVPGNHEYDAQAIHNMDLVSMFKSLEAAGIMPLKDEALTIGGMYLVGRDDPDSNTRAPLSLLLEEADEKQPIVVLDHEPLRLSEAEKAGVDLQLSGHTHAGQLFPGGLLTELFGIFEYSYGYHRRDAYQIIVSSGAGAWGFPMRVGSPAEIVLVTLKGT